MDAADGVPYGLVAASEEEGPGAAPDASLEEILNTADKVAEGDVGARTGEGEAEAEADPNGYEAEYAYRAPPGRTKGGHRSGYGASAYYAGGGGGDFNQSDYVLVDAHVLASPVLADINGDGHMEVGGVWIVAHAICSVLLLSISPHRCWCRCPTTSTRPSTQGRTWALTRSCLWRAAWPAGTWTSSAGPGSCT